MRLLTGVSRLRQQLCRPHFPGAIRFSFLVRGSSLASCSLYAQLGCQASKAGAGKHSAGSAPQERDGRPRGSPLAASEDGGLMDVLEGARSPSRGLVWASAGAARRGGDPCFHRGSAGRRLGGGEGATFFFGVGRCPQIRFAGGVDGGARREGPSLPPFFPPLFGFFSWSGHSRGRARDRAPWREAVDPRLSGPLPDVFFSFPLPRVAPARRMLARSGRSWSA